MKRMPEERFKVLRIFLERRPVPPEHRDHAIAEVLEEADRARESEWRLLRVLVLVHELMTAPPDARDEAFARLKEDLAKLERKP